MKLIFNMRVQCVRVWAKLQCKARSKLSRSIIPKYAVPRDMCTDSIFYVEESISEFSSKFNRFCH